MKFCDCDEQLDKAAKKIIKQQEIIDHLYCEIELWKGALMNPLITKYANELFKDE